MGKTLRQAIKKRMAEENRKDRERDVRKIAVIRKSLAGILVGHLYKMASPDKKDLRDAIGALDKIRARASITPTSMQS